VSVADIGPRRKLGEISVKQHVVLALMVIQIMVEAERKIIRYEIFPGTPANVDGTTYNLTPYKT